MRIFTAAALSDKMKILLQIPYENTRCALDEVHDDKDFIVGESESSLISLH